MSPGNAVVGFPPGEVINGTIHAGDAVAAQAQSDLTAAYNDAAGRACDVNLTGQDLGGLTLTAGVYCFDSSAQLTGTLTLDAQGDPDAVWIFQIGSTLTTASGSSVNLIDGAQACNVFWQVGSSATLGTGTSFVGTIMALTSITANTDATVQGRLLARNGAVTLDSNEITRPECAPPPPPEEASITIAKETEPDSPQDFEFAGDLGAFVLDDDPLSATPRQRRFDVDPGTYTITESEVQGFDLESINCTGGQTNVDVAQRRVVVQVADGDEVSCVFVNEAEEPPPPPQDQASITIAKETEPDSPQNFEFTGELGNFFLDDDPLSATPRQRRFDVEPGTYTIRESEVEGFDLESITCTGGQVDVDLARRRVVITVEAGETLSCVFVNEAEAPPPPPPGQASITIVKEVEPDGPQNFEFTGELGNFILDDDLLSATPRERTFDVEPGTYTIRESEVEGFDLESITCTGGQVRVDLARRQVVITVEAGETLSCVFVNEAEELPPPPPPGQASITIVKEVEPDNPQNFEFTGDLGEFILDDDLLSATPRERTFDVEPGTYTVSELALQGWDLESITCTGGQVEVDLARRRVVITVEPGETLTCVFVNEAEELPPPPGQASITIVKEVEPDNPQNFEFTGDLGEFILDDDLLSATPRERRFEVEPGTYTIRESAVSGFDLESITCTGGQVRVDLARRRVVITVQPGETLSCVFVNEAEDIPPPPPGQASITIVKDAEPDSPQNFEFTGDLGDFILDDDLLSATPRERRFDVEPGTYTITESELPLGAESYDLESITCTGGQVDVNLELRQVIITVEAGETLTCVFVNEAEAPPPPPDDAAITIVKEVEPASPQNFEFTGDLGDFILDDDPLSATPRQRRFDVEPGTYTVREPKVQSADGFLLKSITCTRDQGDVDLSLRRAVITVDAGESVTCVFVNIGEGPSPPPSDGGGPGRGSRGGGLALTGLALGGALALSVALMSSGGGFLYAGQHRPGQHRPGQHRPGQHRPGRHRPGRAGAATGHSR